MHDLVDAVGQPPRPAPEADAVTGEVPAHGRDPFAVGVPGAEQAVQRAPQPPLGSGLAGCAHERVQGRSVCSR